MLRTRFLSLPRQFTCAIASPLFSSSRSITNDKRQPVSASSTPAPTSKPIPPDEELQLEGFPEMSQNSEKIMQNPNPGSKKTASGMTRAEAAKQREELAKAAVEFGKKHEMIASDFSKSQQQQQSNNNKPSSSQSGRKVAPSTSSDSLVDTSSGTGNTLSTHRDQYEKKKASGASFKVKRKAPWGSQQLRDAWSEDAMSRHDKDSVGERIDREYRYHPEAYLRKYIKWVGLAIPPSIVFSFSIGYYWASGYSVYKVGDFQAILNILRQFDTSPRSALFLPKTAGNLSTPFELTEGDGPRRRRVGAREEYEALVKQYREAKRAAENASDHLAPGGMARY